MEERQTDGESKGSKRVRSSKTTVVEIRQKLIRKE